MNTALDFLAVFLLASPSFSYFKYQRQVRLPNWGRQHYLVRDDTVWSHARPDLGDLRRLYVGDREAALRCARCEPWPAAGSSTPCFALVIFGINNRPQFLHAELDWLVWERAAGVVPLWLKLSCSPSGEVLAALQGVWTPHR